MQNPIIRTIFYLFTLTAPSILAVNSHAADALKFDSAELHIRLTPRSPQQIAAFYEARGFGKAMLDKIKQYCFITVYVKNTSNKIIWLDLSNWQFTAAGAPVHRFDRQQLLKGWQDMGIAQAHQSLFRWTLLPEKLDFQINEREGGNIVLPRIEQALTLHARFDTLSNKSGQPISIQLDNIHCANEPQ